MVMEVLADSGRLLARTRARPSVPVGFAVPVPDGKRTCRIGFTVTPTAVPAETIHAVRNVGTASSAELATYVVEQGKPLGLLVE